jgi:hypothetical protein
VTSACRLATGFGGHSIGALSLPVRVWVVPQVGSNPHGYYPAEFNLPPMVSCHVDSCHTAHHIPLRNKRIYDVESRHDTGRQSIARCIRGQIVAARSGVIAGTGVLLFAVLLYSGVASRQFGPTHADPGADHQLLVLRPEPSSSGTPIHNIWAIRADGKGLRRITNETGDVLDFDVASDGSRLVAVVREGPLATGLWRMESDGTQPPGSPRRPIRRSMPTRHGALRAMFSSTSAAISSHCAPVGALRAHPPPPPPPHSAC